MLQYDILSSAFLREPSISLGDNRPVTELDAPVDVLRYDICPHYRTIDMITDGSPSDRTNILPDRANTPLGRPDMPRSVSQDRYRDRVW